MDFIVTPPCLISTEHISDSTMAASRVLPFPLVIICLLLIRGSSSLPTTSGLTGRPQSPNGSSTKGPFFSTDGDYDSSEETVTPISPVGVSQQGGIPQRCNYDPCREGQVSCASLAATNNCLCPGSTLYNVPPEAPTLKSVAWNGSQVVIKWCAPNSFVKSYQVTVGGQERQTFEKGQRSGTVGDIDHIAKASAPAQVPPAKSLRAEETCRDVQLELELYLTM
ncbi:hypothetical protein INR49_000589 [Caranx melampygus]|nr:hypothetical protein INR49_000589 [Caranx melampygus]